MDMMISANDIIKWYNKFLDEVRKLKCSDIYWLCPKVSLVKIEENKVYIKKHEHETYKNKFYEYDTYSVIKDVFQSLSEDYSVIVIDNNNEILTNNDLQKKIPCFQTISEYIEINVLRADAYKNLGYCCESACEKSPIFLYIEFLEKRLKII